MSQQDKNTHNELITERSRKWLWAENTRLLLVEDNYINQELIKFLLEDIGLEADIVSDGKEAIDLLSMTKEGAPYTLILMDCQMPIMDGFTATRHIRCGLATERYTTIPIIALTANAMLGDREKCLEAGMNDYLSKPIDNDKLEGVLKKWLLPQ